MENFILICPGGKVFGNTGPAEDEKELLGRLLDSSTVLWGNFLFGWEAACPDRPKGVGGFYYSLVLVYHSRELILAQLLDHMVKIKIFFQAVLTISKGVHREFSKNRDGDHFQRHQGFHPDHLPGTGDIDGE